MPIIHSHTSLAASSSAVSTSFWSSCAKKKNLSKNLGQGSDLVQQRLALAGGVLGHLAQQMLDGLARVRDRDALGRVDACDLVGQEELGYFDG